jgi:hypothetical protein
MANGRGKSGEGRGKREGFAHFPFAIGHFPFAIWHVLLPVLAQNPLFSLVIKTGQCIEKR